MGIRPQWINPTAGVLQGLGLTWQDVMGRLSRVTAAHQQAVSQETKVDTCGERKKKDPPPSLSPCMYYAAIIGHNSKIGRKTCRQVQCSNKR